MLNRRNYLQVPMRLASVARRVKRALGVRIKRLGIRIRYILGFRAPSRIKIEVLPWPSAAAVPGWLERQDEFETIWQTDRGYALGKSVLNHQVEIFREEPVDISMGRGASDGRECSLHLQTEPLSDIVYKPINWHQDVFSGYTWPSDAFYQNIQVHVKPGSDIKVPRELSRFQHVAALQACGKKPAATEFMLQVTDWIENNPFGFGVNWECSMDISLRAINWIWGIRLFQSELVGRIDFLDRIANSLRDHGAHIYETLDYYGEEIPTGNHYLADIAGLVYIGASIPNIPEADLWLAFGIQEILSEMKREVLEDGMCHEASTSYHRLVAELFVSCAALIERIPSERREQLNALDIRKHRVQPILKPLSEAGCNLTKEGQILPQSFYAKLEKMALFTLAVRKPNGQIWQIGDNDSSRVHKLTPSAFGEPLIHDHLLHAVGQLIGNDGLIEAGKADEAEGNILCGGLQLKCPTTNPESADLDYTKHFIESGIVVQKKGKAWLGVTCGNSGQQGRGGHGHNDKNSFELNINGMDIFVDGGCPTYTSSPRQRNKFRATEYHTTIHVLGREQNEWKDGSKGLFSLCERADPKLSIAADGRIVGSHTGYGEKHSRSFTLSETDLLIEDILPGSSPRYVAYNLHPDVAIISQEEVGRHIAIELYHLNGIKVSMKVVGARNPSIGNGAYSTGYMREKQNKRILMQLTCEKLTTHLKWSIS
jgi:hypothetical protein